MILPTQTHALFISDLHLQPLHPRTTSAFFAFLQNRAMAARALYLLGDVFEYWAGDDDLSSPLHQDIARAIRAVADAGVEVYWIAGNRDFLVGQAFADAAGLTLLAEPHVIDVAGRRIALVHGDAQCTDDAPYMQFRRTVRDPAWQAAFLAKPLAERKAIIASLREGSKASQAGKSYELMDVAPAAVAELHKHTGADIIIHGHTHRPALHRDGLRLRYVLPDWEPDAEPPRGGWIAIEADGERAGAITRYDLDGVALP